MGLDDYDDYYDHILALNVYDCACGTSDFPELYNYTLKGQHPIHQSAELWCVL